LLAALLFHIVSQHTQLKNFGKWCIGTLLLVLIFVPFLRLSIAEYSLSLVPNFSVGSIAIFTGVLWKRITGKTLLSQRDFNLFCLWNTLLALCLYISSLSLIDFDLYYLGYDFSMWFIMVAMLTTFLVWLQNPLFYIFIAYIIAFNLGLSFTNNFFDYIIDPVAVIISLGSLTMLATRFTQRFFL